MIGQQLLRMIYAAIRNIFVHGELWPVKLERDREEYIRKYRGFQLGFVFLQFVNEI